MRRILIISARVLLVLLVVVAGLGVGALLYLRTEAGRETLVQMINDLGRTADGGGVSIGAIGEGLPFRLAVTDVSVADASGPWLTVEAAHVTWRPAALFAGRVHVTEAAASGVDVLRLPEPAAAPDAEPPEDADAGIALPSLPVDVRIERLRVEPVTVAAAIAGEAATLGLEGRLAAEAGDAVVTELRIERIDGTGGAFTVEAALDPRAETLRLAARLAEPEGGLVMRLAGLEPFPPLTVTLVGDGPLDAWPGHIAARAEGLFTVAADVTVSDASSLTLGGVADMTPLLSADLAPVVGDALGFDLAARIEDEAVIIERASVRAAAADVEAEGRVDGDRVRAEAAVRVTDAQALGSLVAPAALAGGTLRLAVEGDLAAPRVRADGRLDSVQAPGVTVGAVEMTLSAAPKPDAAESIGFDLRIDAADLALDDPAAASLVGDTASLTAAGAVDLAGGSVAVDRLAADLAVARLLGRARYGLDDGDLEANIDVTLDDLGAVAPIVGMPLRGTALISAGVSGNVERLEVGGSVAAALADATTGEPLLDALLGASPDLSAGFALAGSDVLTVEDIALDGALLTVRGRVSLADGLQRLAAEVTARVADLAPLSDPLGTPLGGSLLLGATAAGPVADPSVRIRLQAPEAVVDGTRIGDLDVQGQAATVVSAPAGDVSAAAETPYGRAALSTAFALAGGDRLQLRNIAARLGGASLDGNLAIPFDGASVEGAVTARLSPEGITIDGQRLSGRATLAVRFGAGAGQTVDLDLAAENLRFAAAGGEPVTLTGLTARGGVADALGTPRLSLDVNARGLSAGGTTVDTLTADVGGTLEEGRFSLAAAGAGEPALRLDAAGGFGVREGTTRISLATAEVVAGEHRLALQAPASVTLAGSRIVVEAPALALDDGRLAVSADLGGSAPAARLTAERLPLSLADLAAPGLGLQGTLDADLDIRRDGGQLGGKVRVAVSDLTQATATTTLGATPKLGATLDGTWAGGIVDVEAVVTGFGNPLQASARAPFSVDAATLTPRIDERASITGQVRWEGETEPLVEALPVDEHRVTGPGRIAIDLAGSIAEPRVTGEVALDQGSYEHLLFGTLVRPLTVRAASAGGRAFDLTVDGRDGGNGTITANGRIDIEEGAVSLETAFRQAVLVRRDDATAQATGDLSVAVGPGGGQISGRIETDRVEIRLVDTLPPSVVELEVIEIRTEADLAAAAEREQAEPPPDPDPITLDLTVVMPRRVFVGGRGLESEWRGDLRITGTVDDPRIVGTISIVRGSFTFADKPFRLTAGRIEFFGGRTIDPRIDIEATYQGRDAAAVLGVSGPASDLQISISSPQGLPESEVLPRALFGKSSSEMSPAEALDLALALDTLRGGGSISESTIGSVRQALGLDTLAVDPGLTGDDGPSVRVGRYVTEDIYVETRQGTTPGTTTYRAEYRITPEISAEAEVGDAASDSQGSIGLKWQRDY